MSSLTAFLFGITVALAIGPIALIIINASATAGANVGTRCAFGAAFADFTFAMVAFLAGSFVQRALVAHRPFISWFASLILICLGVWMAARARGQGNAVGASFPDVFRKHPLRATYVLTIVNPLTILAFVAFSPMLGQTLSPLRAIWYAVCVLLGSLIIQLGLAMGGAGLGRLLRSQWHLRLLNLLSGAGIALFGVAGLVREILR